MRRALIGHTGFVGSNLAAAGGFTDFYNSANFGQLAGESFDEVVCCGITAVKWLANREPEADWAGIRRLLDILDRSRIARFVLISTIDVYPDPAQPLDEHAALGELPNHAYGRHRLAVEAWAAERYANHMILRLPALFGPGLKKNALYDLLHDNNVAQINPAGVFQWYPVARLAGDFACASMKGLRLVNLFPAPLAMRDIIDTHFPAADVGPPREPAPVYRLRTHHAELFGGRDGYIMDAGAVMAALADYVASVRATAGNGR